MAFSLAVVGFGQLARRGGEWGAPFVEHARRRQAERRRLQAEPQRAEPQQQAQQAERQQAEREGLKEEAEREGLKEEAEREGLKEEAEPEGDATGDADPCADLVDLAASIVARVGKARKDEGRCPWAGPE